MSCEASAMQTILKCQAFIYLKIKRKLVFRMLSAAAVSYGDNLHKMPKPVFWEEKGKIAKDHLLKILPSMLSAESIICKSL